MSTKFQARALRAAPGLAMALGLVAAASAANVTFEGGVVLDTGMPDVRIRELGRQRDGDLFGKQIASKGQTYEAYFNGKKPLPTMSYPKPEADTNADVLTKAEQEAGLDRWWSDGGGEKPSDEALAEFDEVAGNLQRVRFYSLANPVADAMYADVGDWSKVRAALLYTGGYGLSYYGLIFGANAVEGGLTLDRAIQHIVDTLGVTPDKARGYLAGPSGNGYGSATFTFYVQKKAPHAEGENPRGEPTDTALYDKFENTVAEFKPVLGGALNKDLHPGLKDPVPMKEPFDPGAAASTDTATLQATNMEVFASYTKQGGAEVMTRNYFYVENYRQITQVDANFTGDLASSKVENSRKVAKDVRAPNALPYSDAEGGTASIELPDQAQQAGVFRAIVELGDGLNGYVKYHSKVHNKDTVLFWVAPAQVPGGQKTRWGTSIRGPGIGPMSAEDPSLLEELVQSNSGLHWINPPQDMRAWLDPLLFDGTTGQANRPEIVNALVKEKFASGGANAFGGYAPFAVYNSGNGHYSEIPLDFDLAKTGESQESGIFKAGDILLAQNYTQEAPTGKLFKLAYENTPPEDLPSDTKGNKIPPTGENLFLEAQSCCGVSSIVGGATVKKSDENRPEAQITAVSSQQESAAGAIVRPVRVTATVPNDPRAALDPIGGYDLLYPLTRIHKALPALPQVQGGVATGVQGQDAKFYGNYVNDAPVWAYAPAHPSYQGPEFQARTLANPVDAEGTPFMNLNGTVAGAGREDPNYQDFRQGHRYTVTLAAYDNLSPLILPATPEMQERGFPAEGYVCYPIRHMQYRLFRLDGEREVTVFDGVVVDQQQYAGADCVDKEPMIELEWVPHADGPHYWEVYVVDITGRDRKLIAQAEVTGEASEIRQLDSETRRAR